MKLINPVPNPRRGAHEWQVSEVGFCTETFTVTGRRKGEEIAELRQALHDKNAENRRLKRRLEEARGLVCMLNEEAGSSASQTALGGRTIRINTNAITDIQLLIDALRAAKDAINEHHNKEQ